MLNCPIKHELVRATNLGGEFSKSMALVREKIDLCEKCKELKTCSVKKEFDSMVDEVIAELNDEWGL